MKDVKILQSVGKRKTSIARATIRAGSGRITINSLLLSAYNPEMSRSLISEPLILSGELASKVDIAVIVMGGGVMSQAQAIRTAVANPLIDFSNDKALKDKFLEYDRHMLVDDIRQAEMSKPYRSRPRARRQKSKR